MKGFGQGAGASFAIQADIVKRWLRAALTREPPIDPLELARLQQYFRSKFGLGNISVRGRPNKDDSAEVYFGDEFVGVIFKDEEDGDTSYDFNMAILEIDLPERL